MNENLNTELGNTKTEQSKVAVKKDALGLLSSLKIFLIELLDFPSRYGPRGYCSCH